MRRLLDASPGAMGYDDYKRFLSSNNGGFGFEEAGYANQYSNVDIGIGVGVEEERLTIDPPPVLPPLPAGGGETTTTQSLHSGIIVGLSRWETVGTTIIVVLVMMMLERWWKAVRRWVEFMRRGENVPGVEREDAGAKVVREGENEEETVMDKQEERRAVGMDKNVDLVSPPLSKPTPASAVNEDKEVDANDAGYSPPPAPVPITPSASSNSANLTTLLVPTTPITTPVILVGEETDKEDNSDTEDFVVITENGAGGISTPKHQGEVPSTPTPDTPMKKKKTRRGKRPAKKPKNWNGVVAGEMVQGNGPALGKDGEVQETKTQTPVLAESSLIVKSAAKPVSTPSPSLLVSDTVLGKPFLSFAHICLYLIPSLIARVRFAWYSSLPGLSPRTSSSRQTSLSGFRHSRLSRGFHPPRIRRPSQRHPILLPRSPRWILVHRIGVMSCKFGGYHRDAR
jgi:hypothetical protein